MTELASYYYFIFWLMVTILTINKYIQLNNLSGYRVLYQQDNDTPLVLFSIFYIIFWGFRPIAPVFGDTVSYSVSYENMFNSGMIEGSGASESDWLFTNIMFICSQVINVNMFFTIVLFFYVVMMYRGCKKMDERHGMTLMLFCIGAYSFYTFSVNGIRNGVACSFVIMAIAGVCKGERIWPIVFSFIAIGCHKSAALPLACMYFTYFVKNPYFMYVVWLGAIAISLIFGELIDNLLTLISFDERLSEGLLEDEADGLELNHSFRWDFLLYGSMPILLGAYTLFIRKVYNNTYLILLGTYIYANAFWVLAIRAIFSNRIAYLSWFIYPIVLAYPLLNLPIFKNNQSKISALILLIHFLFTTFMWLIGK